MSIQNETNRVQYWGNESTEIAYPVPFYFFESGDLRVVVTDAAGNDAELEEGGGYSVAGAGNENGGSVWTVSIVPTTSRVTIYREVSAVQTTVYEENGEFPAKTHERALDRQTMLNQQNARAFDRSLKVRESDGEKSAMTAVGNSVIGFGADLQPRTFTPSQLAVWLNLTQQVFGEGTKTWLTEADRPSAVPDFLGQVGVQLSDASLWVANGTSAGNWTDPVPGVADGSIATVKLADGIFSADTTGRAKMADAFITLAKIGEGIFTADSTGRGKFASGFIDSSLCSSDLWNAIAPAGAVLQTVTVSRNDEFSTTSQIPYDNTKPQKGEGLQIMSASITPLSTSNKIKILFGGFVSSAAPAAATYCVFKPNVSDDALGSWMSSIGGDGYANQVFFEYTDSPASISSQTYSIRCGPNTSVTLFFNRLYTPGSKFNGTLTQTFTLQEIKG
ncbi:MAG: hypothetical protein BGO12_19770 [Verrucomicrobia bacterium 61-8]|nr:hypothetical protein [Verrucomicrobiota bacterium]OJV17452.1 MAG: hypothetical protein BGO12_19770 [Verrucomicrobia bacterium 61-8]